MMKEADTHLLSRILQVAVVVAALAITPGISYDPINSPKLLVLSLCGFSAAAILIMNLRVLLTKSYRGISFVLLFFLVDLTLVLFFSKANLDQQFFGVSHRKTGFLTYFTLSLLLLAAVLVSRLKTLERFVHLLVGAGVFAASYGLIQHFGFDPADWINPYSPVMGFLGNPNFQAASLGMVGTAVFAQLLDRTLGAKAKWVYGIFFTIILFVIKTTRAQQGFLVLFAGVGVVLFALIYRSKFRKFTNLYFALSLAGTILVAFGSLNKGPLAQFLYKDSVTVRGWYWSAAWKMAESNPIFGVGLDSFGDWYRWARPAEVARSNPDLMSNVAHSVPLDFASNGGFPLLAIYLLILTLTVLSAIKVFRREDTFNVAFTSIFAVWVAYQAQSLISINNIGLAIWGWVFSGLVIGYEIHSRDPISETVSTKEPSVKSKGLKGAAKQEASAGTSMAVFVGLVVGSILGFPDFLGSVQYRSALESGSLVKLVAAANARPYNEFRFIEVAIHLRDGKFAKESLDIIHKIVAEYPRSSIGFDLLNQSEIATQVEKDLALKRMKELDPNNPNLKLK